MSTSLARARQSTTAALLAGGFDRPTIHMSRVTLKVTERDWNELSKSYSALLDQIEALEAERADSEDATVNATTILMLFEGAPSDQEPAETHVDVPISSLKLWRRATALAEEIQAMIAEPDQNWGAVATAADELAAVARAT